jgi:RNA polymerase sigma factor (sigma-70 family)
LPTDEELIWEIQSGSQAAMEVLVKRYYKTVFGFLYRKIGDYHTAYDLTQEVFIRVMKSLASYQEDGKFEHWLMTVSIHCCHDYFRSREYAEKAHVVEYDDRYEEPNVSNLLEKSLRHQEVKAAILSLPEEQRDAVILYYYNGYKIREISKLTNAKEATVKSRMRQALIKLKIALLRGEQYAKQD